MWLHPDIFSVGLQDEEREKRWEVGNSARVCMMFGESGGTEGVKRDGREGGKREKESIHICPSDLFYSAHTEKASTKDHRKHIICHFTHARQPGHFFDVFDTAALDSFSVFFTVLSYFLHATLGGCASL